MKKQECQRIRIVCFQRTFIFDIEVFLYQLNCHTTKYKPGAKDFLTAKFHVNTWDLYLILGCVSAQNSCNRISYLKRQQLYNALQSQLVLYSTSTCSSICQRECSLTVDAIYKQLPSRTKVSSALNWLPSMNKLAITSVITWYMDWNWAFWVVQLAFNTVNSLLFSNFEI